MTQLVGLDVGTTGVKALALSPEGDVLARAEESYDLSTPHPGWAEQDPEDWWRAAERALAALGGQPTAIGLSGQMHGLVVLDDRDRVLRPAILWNDQRTEAECVEIEERVGLTRLIQLTGNRALTGFTAPKLLWLRGTSRPRTRGSHTCCCRRTTSVCVLPASTRSTSRTHRAPCCSTSRGAAGATRCSTALELDPAWLPRALESPEVSGETAAGIPVAAGAGDQAAAALGVGVDRPGPVSVVLGTSGTVFAALPAFAADPQARVHAFCHAVPGGWHAMGVMLSAAGSLRWLRDALGGGSGYDELTAAAQEWPPGTEGLTFLPYLTGERTPHADPHARAAFAGLTLRHDRGALVRAVLEGVAYGLRDSLELLRELGVDPRAGHVSGGGARSELWLRIIASVLGLPIQRTETDEGSAYGAALLGGVAAGVFRDVHEAVATCVRLLDPVEPDPSGVPRMSAATAASDCSIQPFDPWRTHDDVQDGTAAPVSAER